MDDLRPRAGLRALSSLLGTWRIERTIRHADGRVDRMAGAARFFRSGGQVVEDVTGRLVLGAGQGPLTATRRYLWREVGGRLECAFADGRPFHTVPLGVERPETTFLCPPDRYHVTYDFSRLPDWTSLWKVEGPRKGYLMETRYRAADDRTP